MSITDNKLEIMSFTETVALKGHLVDSLLLAKVLDAIVEAGATYHLAELDLGATSSDTSHVSLEIAAATKESLEELLSSLAPHGVTRELVDDARLEPAPKDGVLPAEFYPTSNLPTQVSFRGHWLDVVRPEMDCALVISEDGPTARAVPMHKVRQGEMVVVGWTGVRTDESARKDTGSSFSFMSSEVSSEKPKELSSEIVADSLRRARVRRLGGEPGGKVLVVCGPAVVHTGANKALAQLVRGGWVDVLFAGNGFGTHDIESSVLGTSLGVALIDGMPAEHGHANHLRIINSVRGFGSVAAAVEAGFVTSGVLYECVKAQVPFILAGSVRDDGPLPDVITDTVAAADAMRDQLDDVGVSLMLASTLHGIATGNLLPSSVETYCVDINQAVATKLTDRGSHQATGIVTDVGLFVAHLANLLGSHE